MSQSFVLSPEWNGYRPSATRLVQKLTFFVFTSAEGKGTPLPFGVPPPIIWLHFLLPLPMSGDPRSLRCKHLCDPQSFLTVTFWLLDNFSSTGREYHSHLLVFVSHHVTVSVIKKDWDGSLNIFFFFFFFFFFFIFILKLNIWMRGRSKSSQLHPERGHNWRLPLLMKIEKLILIFF